MRHRIDSRVVRICLLSLLASGCGKASDQWVANRPKVVPAEGIVKYSGDPLVGATIVFSPQNEKGIAAQAITDAAGRFQLMAYPPEKGAVPGQYKISITKLEAPAAPNVTPGKDGAHDETPTGPTKSLIPERYGNAETSGLSADIPLEGKTDLTITFN